MEVKWTEKAISEYNKVIDYSLSEFGRSATTDLSKRVEKAVAKISKYPSASPLFTSVEIPNHIFRNITLKGPLSLIYEEREDFCIVHTIWNSNMHPSRLTKILK